MSEQQANKGDRATDIVRPSFLDRMEHAVHRMLGIQIWRILLILISFATTAYGGFLLYHTPADSSNGLSLLAVLLPLIGAGILHAFIVSALKEFSEQRRWIFIPPVILMQLIAVQLSFGTHWVHLQGEAATVGSFSDAQQAVVRDIAAARAAFRAMTEQTRALAEYSEERSNVERASGGTCGPSARGDGPRRRLRGDDRDLFAEIRSKAEAQLVKRDELVAAVEKINIHGAADARNNLAALKTIVNRMRELEADPFLGFVKKSIETRKALGHAPIGAPAERTGAQSTSFICPDPRLDRHLGDLLGTIDRVKPIREINFTDFTDSRTGYRAAVSRLFSVINPAQLFSSVRQSERERRLTQLRGDSEDRPKLLDEDYPPLFLALFVEFALLLSYLKGTRKPTFPKLPGAENIRHALARRGDNLFSDLWKAIGEQQSFWLAIERHLYWHARGARVFVPLGAGGSMEDTKLRTFLEICAASRSVRRVSTGWLIPRLHAIGWDKEARKAIFSARQVRMYSWTHAEMAAILMASLASTMPAGGLRLISSSSEAVSPTTEKEFAA